MGLDRRNYLSFRTEAKGQIPISFNSFATGPWLSQWDGFALDSDLGTGTKENSFCQLRKAATLVAVVASVTV